MLPRFSQERSRTVLHIEAGKYYTRAARGKKSTGA